MAAHRQYSDERAAQLHEYYLRNKERFLDNTKRSQKKLRNTRVRSTLEDGITTLKLRLPSHTKEEEKLLRHDLKQAAYRTVKGTYIVILEGSKGSVMYKEQEDAEIIKAITQVIDTFYESKK